LLIFFCEVYLDVGCGGVDLNHRFLIFQIRNIAGIAPSAE